MVDRYTTNTVLDAGKYKYKLKFVPKATAPGNATAKVCTGTCTVPPGTTVAALVADLTKHYEKELRAPAGLRLLDRTLIKK